MPDTVKRFADVIYIFSMKIYIVVTDVVNDVTYSRKSVNTRVVIQFL